MPGEDKMKIRCKFALIVALLFFMTMMSNELPAFAEPELSLEQAIQNIQECDSKIDNNIDKLNKIKEEVSQKEKQIKDNEEQLKIAKEDVEEKDKKLADRLKGIQLNGGVESTTLQYLDASIFGFGYKKELCSGIETANEKMPDAKDLENLLSLANLSIGQGSLMASPVTLLSLYEAIACEGAYHTPTLVEGIMKNGVTKYEKSPAKIKAMNKNSADIIKTALKKVLVDGTAQSTLCEVDGAGKTATAQTGQRKNGREVEHSWFCGFFPFENPKYVVTILVEDSFGKEKQAMEIFKELTVSLLNR